MSKAAAADGGGGRSSGGGGRRRSIFPQTTLGASLNKYSDGDGREAAPRGQIVRGVERERCVEGRRLRAIGGGGGGR